MARTVNLHAAKTHLSRLVDEAANGKEVVIAKAGKPMVRLVPVDSVRTPRKGFGSLEGQDPHTGEFRRAAAARRAARVRHEMNDLLLDTRVLLWWKEGSRKLGPRARREIEIHAASTPPPRA